jgi:ABC-type sugar transport system ATPase subunit
MSFLQVSGVSLGGERDFVIREVSFGIEQFQKIAIAGETGSGKSSLLKMVAGLVQPDAGSIYFQDEKVKGPAEKLVPGHTAIAYLSQHFELPHSLRVEQVLSYANLLADEAADRLYDLCHITHLLHRRTDQLSGGERQRIAMARLLIGSPTLLLLDEPFSNLDMMHKATLKTIISDISDRLNITCVLVSHDPADTLPWADEMLVMRAGAIVQQGPPRQLYQQPVNTYVAGLLGKYNLVEAGDMAIFSALPGIHQSGKAMVVRPEDFSIVTPSDNAVAGHITKVSFYGSHSEVEVSVAGITITVRPEAHFNPPPGAPVFLTVDPQNIWYVQ